MNKKLKDLKIPNRIKYTVHCPTGPIGACEKHKNAMVNLYRIMGCHTSFEEIESDEPCINCVNEIKAK